MRSENGPLRFTGRFSRCHVAPATVAAVKERKQGLFGNYNCVFVPYFRHFYGINRHFLSVNKRWRRRVQIRTEPEEADSVQEFIYGRERIAEIKLRLQGKETFGKDEAAAGGVRGRATGGTNYSRAGDSTQVNHRLTARHERGSVQVRAARQCLGLLGTSK